MTTACLPSVTAQLPVGSQPRPMLDHGVLAAGHGWETLYTGTGPGSHVHRDVLPIITCNRAVVRRNSSLFKHTSQTPSPPHNHNHITTTTQQHTTTHNNTQQHTTTHNHTQPHTTTQTHNQTDTQTHKRTTHNAQSSRNNTQ